MKFNDRQCKLIDFVRVQHGAQTRKYTGESYFTHPVEVAGIVNRYLQPEDLGVEVALCHDLLEDTNCTEEKLLEELNFCGYSYIEAQYITHTVSELTDFYTKEKFPDKNRKRRKLLETLRLGQVSWLAQSVKYGDLMHNTESIVRHDRNFAKVYLAEKLDLLDKMRHGEINLFAECCHSLVVARGQLGRVLYPHYRRIK